ncbi:MAG: AAA family ATPase, partial [Betaproteobacteria bacterium]
MIESLSLKNFKAWREVDSLEFGRITGLFGANSSGKTSLLQSLLLLKQTSESADRSLPLDLGDGRNLVELGTFRDILHRHDLGSELEWTLTWRLPHVLQVIDPQQQGAVLFGSERLTHSARIGWLNGGGVGRMAVAQHSYRFSEREFGIRASEGRKGEFDLFFAGKQDFRFVRVQGRAWPLPAPAKSYGFPDQVRGYYQNAGFLSDFELAFETVFAKVFYLGPLREYPRREYAWAGGQPTDVGRRGERVVEALLASRERGAVISEGKGVKRLTVEARVAKWLKELGLIHEFEVRAISPDSKLYEVVVRRTPTSTPVLITDVGFGVSQILPVLTL